MLSAVLSLSLLAAAFDGGQQVTLAEQHRQASAEYRRDERRDTVKTVAAWAVTMLAIYVAGSHAESKQRAMEPATAAVAACLSDFPVLSNSGC